LTSGDLSTRVVYCAWIEPRNYYGVFEPLNNTHQPSDPTSSTQCACTRSSPDSPTSLTISEDINRFDVSISWTGGDDTSVGQTSDGVDIIGTTCDHETDTYVVEWKDSTGTY